MTVRMTCREIAPMLLGEVTVVSKFGLFVGEHLSKQIGQFH